MANANKPLHRVSWAEKIKNDKQYFKDCANYYLGSSHFGQATGSTKSTMQTMYEVYNNKIPMSWFSHITDPLSAKNAAHRAFPAKIRPTNILRTNIDLLLGEWLKRPFRYRVENVGEDGYNRFLDELNKNVRNNLTQRFMAIAQEEAAAAGVPLEEVSQMTPDQIPLPEDVRQSFHSSYKDKQAIKGQKWLKRALIELGIKRKLHKMFKDFLLGGEVVSYKGIHRGEIDYRRLSPLYADYEMSAENEFIEDGEWFTYVFYLTASDVVDLAYDELDEAAHKKIDQYGTGRHEPSVMYNYLERSMGTEGMNKIPVYLTLWKGKKMILEVTYRDPLTGETQVDRLDEAEQHMVKDMYPDAKVKKMWVNEVYETWRIGDADGGIYFRMQPVEAQRNEMNNFSVCKLPANGRKYSDTHADNISVMQIGIPYLIMYLITGRALELTIAKSKGKILLIDQRAIPEGKGWDEEKFFYYSESMGYGLLNRNQIGVDKSWNQYQVMDMSLYDQIEQLIMLQQHFKQEWDDIIGISRQRKGQTYASDTNSANERANYQSTIITEMIFAGFDEFVEREMQGLLDLSKFVNASGLRRLYNGTELDDVLLEIDPVEYCSASLGVFMSDEHSDGDALDFMKMQVQNFIQNGMKASTVLEMLSVGNIAEMKAKLKYIEEVEAQAQQATQEAEFDAQAAEDDRKMRFMEYEKILEEQLIHTEYDRKEDLVALEGEFNILSFGADQDANGNGVPDATEVLKRQTEREKIQSQERMKAQELLLKERLERGKLAIEEMQKQRELKAKERMEDKKNATAVKVAKMKPKPKPAAKKK